jgi:hypothetical protein
LVNLMLRRLNHKVDIQRKVSPGTNSGYHWSANGYTRHKMPIHNIHVDIVSACLSSFSYLFAETAEIGRENRRGKLDLRATFHS